MKLQQGIRKLILIQAGSHRFSVFPMDNPVSIYGRNNLGKSQSINALQFLLFNNSKDMDFGSYDSSQSKEFYFKSEYSMIIAEIMVQEGVFLIGAAGKGPLHQYEYEHFLIKTHFKKSDFFDDDQHLKAKDIFKNFEKNGHPVNFLNKDQLKLALTGNYHAANIKHDITLFPIREATDSRIKVFNQIFKNLLTMKKLSDREIKSLVLEVFSNVLANTKVDFMRVRAEAFREYDGLKHEVEMIKDNEGEIRKLQTDFSTMITSRESLSDIKSRLRHICEVRLTKIPDETEEVLAKKVELQNVLDNSKVIFDAIMSAQQDTTSCLTLIRKSIETLESHKNYFNLILSMNHNDHDLVIAKYQNSINSYSSKRSDLSRSIDTTQKVSTSVLRKNIQDQESRIEDLESELSRITNRDTWMDQLNYTAEEKQKLSKVLNPKFMNLSKSKMFSSSNLPNVFDKAFEIDGNQFISDEVSIDVSSIRSQSFKDEDPAEVQMQIEMAKARLDQLMTELNVASDLEAALASLATLDAQIKKESADLQTFESFIENLKTEPEMIARQSELEEELKSCKERLVAESERNHMIENQIRGCDEKIRSLRLESDSLRTIGHESFYRDPAAPFVDIDADDNILSNNDYIASLIDDGKQQYGRFKGSETAFNNSKERIFTRYTKHAAEQDDADIVRKLTEELDAMPEKINFLDKLHHEAVVKLASALNNLQKNYQRLESQINDFNRKVNSKKVSNLKSFKLRLLPNQKALDAIMTLMSSIEKDALDLFSSTSDKKMDLALSNDAINYLGDMVDELGGHSLTIAELFELGFEITDANDNTVTHTKIDGHVSNGTTMTIKALLNMNLMRFFFDNRVVVHLPFYVDEATNIDDTNRRSLNTTSFDLGFTPIYASVDPVITASYNINLEEAETEHGLIVPEECWIRIQDKPDVPAEDQLELI